MSTPTILKGTLETLEPAYGGSVHRVQVADVDDFYRQNRTSFDRYGERHYLQSLGIPPSFFLRHKGPFQQEIVQAQKPLVSANKSVKGILVLEIDGKVRYAAPDKGQSTKDPGALYGLTAENGWKQLKMFTPLGLMRYVKGLHTLAPDGTWTAAPTAEYVPCVFTSLSVFGTRLPSLDVGHFKQLCSNGLVDTRYSATVSFKDSSQSPLLLAKIAEAMYATVCGAREGTAALVNHWKARGATPKDARVILNELLGRSIVPKSMILDSFSHVSRIEENKPVEETSPTSISNEYDIMDMLTYYAHELTSLSAQTKAEAGVFRFFADRAESTGFRTRIVGVNPEKVWAGVLPKQTNPVLN